ncbi:MAG: hypothetical protein QM484_15330 [Woeseiaceae bacterium]
MQLTNTTNDNTGITNLVYLLQAIAVFTALPFFIAVIINYIKKSDVEGSLSESHFRWQIRTFWFSLLWGIIGAILTFVVIGYVILGINFIWVVYRIIKGWLRLNDSQEMYT